MAESNGDSGGGLFSAGTLIGLVVGVAAFLVSAIKTIFSIQDLKQELKDQNDKIDAITTDVSDVKKLLEGDVKNVFSEIKQHSGEIIDIGKKIVELSTRIEYSEKYRNDMNRGFKWLDNKEGSVRSDKKQKSKSNQVSSFQKYQQDEGKEDNIIEDPEKE